MSDGIQVVIEYAFRCEAVDSYLSGRVDNQIVAHIDAHMDYMVLFVAKETEVVALGVVDVADRDALVGLL